jgi:1A family penicillin-binding protein
MSGHKAAPQEASLESFLPWKWVKRTVRFLKLTLITALAGMLLLGLTLLYLRSRPLPPPEIHAASIMYDAAGKEIGPLDSGERREPIRLGQVPKSLILATLAAEDKSFFEHFGFSPTGIARAVLANLEAGKVTQGASTITQQLARNLYLTHDRTWTRKWKEALLTAQLELHFDKKQILEMYLNEIYYGHGAYGIGRASRLYFGKRPEDLTLAESALLAGIPRGPQLYSPYLHPERAKERQRHILRLMAKNGMITAREAKAAMEEHVAVLPPVKTPPSRANHFRDYIIQTAVSRFGLEESVVRRGGLKIYTTLDSGMQQAAEQTVKQVLAGYGDLECALLAIDPGSGEIRAMVGGKDYTRSQFNRVFARRQPGSSFKPVLYLSALENGFTPLTRIMSKPTAFAYEGGVYRPANFQNQYAGHPITLREAIARSDNIYAVTTAFRIGLGKEITMARRLGITSPLRATPSLALGSYATTPFEMARAYATIAAGGIRREPIAIRKIVDPYGRVLAENKPEPVRAVSEAHAFVLTKLLSGVFDPGGTAHRVRYLFTRPAAGKTGTTDWDGWLSGYTPDLAATVWVGYDRDKPLPHDQARLSQTIWAKFMSEATAGKPTRIFPVPPGVKGVYIDEKTGFLATSRCPHTRLEYFVSGTEPTRTCPEHPAPDGSRAPSMLERFLDWLKGLAN